MTGESLAVHSELETILERDLLGPWGGEEEELAGRDRAPATWSASCRRGVHARAEEVDASLGDLGDDEEPQS